VKLRHIGQGGICRWRMCHSSQRTPAARVVALKAETKAHRCMQRCGLARVASDF
jgi:hypothetical protein